MADEGIVKVTTTVVENWQQLQYETDDIQVYQKLCCILDIHNY